MTVLIRHIAPVAHLPLVLRVLRKLEVAQLIDTLILPNPAHVLSGCRGAEALVLAILDGTMPSTRWAAVWMSAGALST